MNLQYIQIDRSTLSKAKVLADELGIHVTTALGMLAFLWFHAGDLADPDTQDPDVFKTKDADQWVFRACAADGLEAQTETQRETFARSLRDALGDISLVVSRDTAVRVPGLKRYFDAEKNRKVSREKANERNRKWRESQKNKEESDASRDDPETISETRKRHPRIDQNRSDQNRPKKEAKSDSWGQDVAQICKTFEAEKPGEKYHFAKNGPDGKALKDLRQTFPIEEICRRYANQLRSIKPDGTKFEPEFWRLPAKIATMDKPKDYSKKSFATIGSAQDFAEANGTSPEFLQFHENGEAP